MAQKINDMAYQNGRFMLEDNNHINLAELLKSVNDGNEIITTNNTYLAIKNGYSFVSGKIFEAVPTLGYAVFHFKTGSKPCEASYVVSSDGFVYFGTHHNVVFTADGTPQYINERNHLWSLTPTAQMFHTPTITNYGQRSVERMNTVGGGPAKGGGSEGDLLTFVVAPNRDVFLVAQNRSSNAANINIVFNWREIEV